LPEWLLRHIRWECLDEEDDPRLGESTEAIVKVVAQALRESRIAGRRVGENDARRESLPFEAIDGIDDLGVFHERVLE
jgi:hypothetical protein